MMIFVNLAEKHGLSRTSYELFVRTLAPFAPHLTEEIWYELGYTESIHLQSYPTGDSSLARDTTVVIGVQVNGKLRGNITIAPDASESEAVALAQADSNIANRLAEGEVAKVIYVPGKILNIVVK
jgi:leucyl-tRNA synthetase